MTNEEIQNLIDNRENTNHGIYSDMGQILDLLDTEDLIRFFVDVTMNGDDFYLREYLQMRIIEDEINRLKNKGADSCGKKEECRNFEKRS